MDPKLFKTILINIKINLANRLASMWLIQLNMWYGYATVIIQTFCWNFAAAHSDPTCSSRIAFSSGQL